MSQLLSDFPVDAIHTFAVRTLATLGYRTRVALSNASDQRAEFATAYRIDASVHGPDGTRRRTARGLAVLEPGRKILLDCGELEAGFDRDVEIIFHLIPLRLEVAAVAGAVSISRAELMFLFTVADHYVEYYRPDGFAAGVLYQSGAFNYVKSGRDWTTVLQAPKGYVAAEVDTLISLLNTSPDPGYAHTARLKLHLAVPSAGRELAWVEDVPPFTPVLVSLKARVESLGLALGADPTFVCVMALCETATLIPLTINRDLRTGCIGIEHSLPPMYYSTAMTGPLRARAVGKLAATPMFATVARP